jgi:hypothetical protein
MMGGLAEQWVLRSQSGAWIDAGLADIGVGGVPQNCPLGHPQTGWAEEEPVWSILANQIARN